MRHRTQVRSEFVESLVGSGSVNEEVLGLGEDWRPDHPPTAVRLGWQLWRASGYTHIPTYEEVVKHSEKWIGDIVFAQKAYNWRTAQSPIARIAQDSQPPDPEDMVRDYDYTDGTKKENPR